MCDSYTGQNLLSERILKLLWIERKFELNFRSLLAELDCLQSMYGRGLNLYLCNLVVRYQTTFLWRVSQGLVAKGKALVDCLRRWNYSAEDIIKAEQLLKYVINDCCTMRYRFPNNFGSCSELQFTDSSISSLHCELVSFQMNRYLMSAQSVLKQSVAALGVAGDFPAELNNTFSSMYLMLYGELHVMITNTIIEIKRAEGTQAAREDLI